MKIEMQPIFGIYRKAAAGEVQAGRPAPEPAAGVKQDVSDIARGSAMPDKALVGMKAGIHSYLSASADPARLEALRRDIKNGTYRVDTAKLADAILGLTDAL